MESIIAKAGLIFVPREVKEFKKRRLSELGKEKEQISSALSQLFYIQGVEEIDKHEEFVQTSPPILFMYRWERGMALNIVGANGNTCFVTIPDQEIKQIYFIDGEEIKKQKNIIGRSIGGALIAGSVGAIIGGLSGLGEVTTMDTYIVVETNKGKVISMCQNSTKTVFEKKLKDIFKEKVVTSEDIKKRQEIEYLNNI